MSIQYPIENINFYTEGFRCQVSGVRDLKCYTLKYEHFYDYLSFLSGKNIEYRSSNIQRWKSNEGSLRLTFLDDRMHYSMLDVQCSMFDVH